MPLIIIVIVVTTCVIVRHKRNQRQIKKSLTAMSLVSQQSRESQSNQAPTGGANQRANNENVYVSLSTTTDDSPRPEDTHDNEEVQTFMGKNGTVTEDPPPVPTAPTAPTEPESEYNVVQRELKDINQGKLYPRLSQMK